MPNGNWRFGLEKQRAHLESLGIKSLPSLFRVVLEGATRKIPHHALAALPAGAVLKSELFTWCNRHGNYVRIDLEQAAGAGAVTLGGEQPFEWVCANAPIPIAAPRAHQYTNVAIGDADDLREGNMFTALVP